MVLPNFQENLAKYAKLLIAKGINVSEGHTVVIAIDVEHAEFARLLVKEAYAHGAHEVIMQWMDDAVTRACFEHMPMDRLTQVPEYRQLAMTAELAQKASRLYIRGANPDALEGIDPARLGAVSKANSQAQQPLRLATQANKVSWTVACAASAAWAEKIFPGAATSEEAVALFWDQIFKICRVYEDDPILAWDQHEALLDEKAAILNEKAFTALHFRAPGTDLKLGLPQGHIWSSAGSDNAQGEHFIANMPTEEVFTAPDFRRADGYVTSTKPLAYNGNVIEGIKVTFEAGEIVDVSADKGDEVIKQLVFDNRGARALGEVALVPDASPISQSGLTFFNTIFDENASNHLAIGSAYAFCLEGGTEMDEASLEAAGLNRSDVHVDFMIGSNQMDVDGFLPDGTCVPIFRQGAWVI